MYYTINKIATTLTIVTPLLASPTTTLHQYSHITTPSTTSQTRSHYNQSPPTISDTTNTIITTTSAGTTPIYDTSTADTQSDTRASGCVHQEAYHQSATTAGVGVYYYHTTTSATSTGTEELLGKNVTRAMFRDGGGEGTMIILTDTESNTDIVFTLESLTQASIIFVMGLAIIISNVLIIATFLNFRGQNEVINHYLLSLAVADLLCGLFVIPLSVYPAVVQEWVYGDIICRLVGYLEVTLWAVSVYTFMWISVDRYLAIRKPLRYETVQTKTRCQCWMAFTWISAAMLCCPPLLGFNKPLFDSDSYICMLDWGNMAAYTVTLAILVLGPSLITIIYTYTYIFSMVRKLRSGEPIHDKEYATALAENLSNPSHIMSFVLVIVFWISWTPYASIRLYEFVTGVKINIPFLHFTMVWIGISNSFWKSLILITLSPQFRLALRIFCMTICCRYSKGRLQAELIGMEDND